MQQLQIEPQSLLGDERTMQAFRGYGWGMQRLIRDLRLDSEGEYEDPDEDELTEDGLVPELPDVIVDGSSSFLQKIKRTKRSFFH